VGSVLAGIAGALMSVPLLAFINASLRALVSGRAEPDEGDAAGSVVPLADVPVDPNELNPPDDR
jgi:hypothetical protein